MKQNFKSTIKQDKKDFIKFLILFLVVVAMICVAIWLLPWIISLKDEAGRAAFEDYIYSKGVFGVFILLGIQIMQVIIAVIPGEPIEVIAGLLYGTMGGYLICTVGMLVGTIAIFYMVKLLGVAFIRRLIGENKLEHYKFLNDTRRLEVLTFILFFIPGTPKDLLTYVMPLTKIKPWVFFLLVTVARIPSIISSTYAGASISQGDWIKTLIIFGCIGAVAILGIIFNDRLMKKFGMRGSKGSKDKDQKELTEKSDD